MNVFFYIMIYIMGIMFGSFYTLAVYRIPKKQDIIHKHSYCPNCNHKLNFFDLIPVFSYVFLRGKCRYCKQKIRPRYFILEILSGFCFVGMAYLTNFNIYNLSVVSIAEFAFFTLYLTFIFLLAGIDKENRNIEKSVTIYGIIISIIYIVYLCTVEKISIYRYGIYLLLYVIILILDTITLKRFAKNSYINGIIFTLITMAIFTGEYITINAIITTALAIIIYILIEKIKNGLKRNIKTEKKICNKISVGYYLAISNIVSLITVLAYFKFII